MSVLSSALNWYQKKIGAYDKQSWEKNVDQQILRGMSAVPKKLGRVKTELIDIDLVRGSAFPKAKPQHSWIAATLSGVIRVVFLPLYFTWWKLQTNALVTKILVVLYILQVYAIFVFYSSDEGFSDVPTSEVITPIAMMLILGILHSQIVATFSIKSSHKRVTRTKRKRLKRKTRVRSSGAYDTKSSPETLSEGRSNSQSPKSCSQEYECCCDPSSCSCIKRNVVNQSLQTKKKCSDDESGLDVMDSTSLVIKEVVPSNHAAGMSTSSPDQGQQSCHLSLSANLSSSHNNLTQKTSYQLCNTDKESSGEEYFYAKRPQPPREEWKDYIFNLNPNFDDRGTDFSNEPLKNHQPNIPHSFSDRGPISDYTLGKRQLEKRPSESGILSQLNDRSHANGMKGFRDRKGARRNYWGLNLNRPKLRKRHGKALPLSLDISKCYSSGDSAPDTTSPNTPLKLLSSDLEWPIITNTDCNSDSSSDSTSSTSHDADASQCENPFAWEIQETARPSVNPGCPSSDKVSCTIWERNECQKVDLSVLDISSAIIRKVDSSVPSTEYLAMGFLFATVIAFIPLLFRLQSGTSINTIQDVTLDVINFTVPSTDYVMQVWRDMVSVMIGSEWRVKTVVLIAMTERFVLSLAYFFLLSVAEKTFKQRFLYAKHFSYLTSSRRAQRTDLPHFRLNKVRNIKTWLSVRSYLKKLGPQRSVDVIVSVAFILEVCVLSFLCVQLLKENGQFSSRLHSWETLFWTLALGLYLLRFMIIGSKLNKKFRNRSVLITEQINLYLHMERKPHKKEELMLANSVLKLAADLLKELESPFKISGLCANPYLYNVTKVVVLSAFSAVLTEILGFKLKLYKIKLQ